MSHGSKKSGKTATEALKLLWQDDFFSSPKKNSEIISELATRRNNFSSAELGMALNRASKTFLTRRGKKMSYEYIEKYPYAGEEEAS
jgi:hypothetical protein